MTNEEYTRYTGTSYMFKTKNLTAAIKHATNACNLGKTRILMLDDETYGVCQNSLAKKFTAAGYEVYRYGLEALNAAQ